KRSLIERSVVNALSGVGREVGLPDVSDDTDDREYGISALNMPADGIFVRPILRREVFIDNHDEFRTRGVLVRENAAAFQRYLQRREESRRNVSIIAMRTGVACLQG